MILDTLLNAEKYLSLHPSFTGAFRFLAGRDLMTLAPGRIDIDGTGLYAMVSAQQGKWPSEARLEAHRKYIDIHYLLSGKETMGWRATSDCREPEQLYDREKDFAQFSDEPSLWLTMHPGTWAIFFPWDAHAPLVSNGDIHKVVIKVAVPPEMTAAT
jgi:YhcH/YjgK/YiaL family protein